MISFHLARVTGVRHVRDHVLWLAFSDGLEGEVDLGPLAANGHEAKPIDRGESATAGVTGSFPPHRLHLLFEWRDLHRAELLDTWNRLCCSEAPLAIPGLE